MSIPECIFGLYTKIICCCAFTVQAVCIENTRLTLTHYAGQSGLELVFGLFHLLLMLTLLARQAADVAVGGLDHGVEVVGVPAVYFTSFQPGKEDTHCFRELAVVWPRTEDAKKE